LNYTNANEVGHIGGFISIDEVFSYITQEEIFEAQLGYCPKEDEKYFSPYRKDNNPGCFFSYNDNGYLYLFDFPKRGQYKYNIHLMNTNCFNCVQLVQGIPNFQDALKYIYYNFCTGKKRRVNKTTTRKRKVSRSKILPLFRKFDNRDKIFWKRLDISSDQLKQDNYLPVSHYKIIKEDNIHLFDVRREVVYCDNSFTSGNKKIYFPYRRKERFFTNCTENDIGFFQYLPDTGKKLIVTKAYKDARILRNSGLEATYLSNEGCFPDLMEDLALRFEEIIVLFDNDIAGLMASQALCGKLSSYTSNYRAVFTPDFNGRTTDVSDLYIYSKKEYLKFIHLELI